MGPDNVIVAGHARALVARQLGLTDVPVIVLAHLTPTHRGALVMADNRLALSAAWDEEMLHLELSALRDADFDLDLLGFNDDEIAALLTDEEATEGLTDEDAARSEEHTSELQSHLNLVCRLLLEKKKKTDIICDKRRIQ